MFRVCFASPAFFQFVYCLTLLWRIPLLFPYQWYPSADYGLGLETRMLNRKDGIHRQVRPLFCTPGDHLFSKFGLAWDVPAFGNAMTIQKVTSVGCFLFYVFGLLAPLGSGSRHLLSQGRHRSAVLQAASEVLGPRDLRRSGTYGVPRAAVVEPPI